jgi:hypothetical protein
VTEDALRARVAELEAALADLLASGQDFAADAMRVFADKDGLTPTGRAAWGRRRARNAAWLVLNKTQGDAR